MSLKAGRFRIRRNRLALGGLLACASALGFASASLATHGPNVFAGNWSTTAGGQAPGSLSLKVVSAATGVPQLQGFGGQPCPNPTTYYSGTYSNLGESGVIVGCTPTPNHLVGRFQSNTKPQPGHSAYGDGDITFTPPKTFSGHLTYEGASYSYTGTFSGHTADDGSGGTAPPSGAPPPGPPTTTPPPPTTPGGPPPPGGPTPPSGTSPSATSGPSSTSPTGAPLSTIHASLGGTPRRGTVVVAEPVPGASVTIGSPNPLSASLRTALVSVTDSLGDFPGSTIVAPGELRPKPAGAAVVCWLLGPDILPIAPSAHGATVDLKFFYGRLNASQAYNSCAALARSITASAAPRRAAKTPTTPGDTCSARPVEVAILANKGSVTAARLVAAPGLGPLAVTYACARAADGSLRISISGPRKGGLRGALGSQLRLGVVRASHAQARNATMTFYFGGPRPPR